MIPARGTSGASKEAELPCYFPWTHASVTPNGVMAPCCYGERYQDAGDLQRVDFKAAWFGHEMAGVRTKMEGGGLMPYCKHCPNWYQRDNHRVRQILAEGACTAAGGAR